MLTVTRIPDTRTVACDACPRETFTRADWQITLTLNYVVLCEGHARRLLAVVTEALMQGEETP